MRRGKTVPTIGDVIYKYIKEKKAPAKVKDFVEIVKEQRTDLRSKNLVATISSVLQRQNRFTKVAPGTYDLRK